MLCRSSLRVTHPALCVCLVRCLRGGQAGSNMEQSRSVSQVCTSQTVIPWECLTQVNAQRKQQARWLARVCTLLERSGPGWAAMSDDFGYPASRPVGELMDSEAILHDVQLGNKLNLEKRRERGYDTPFGRLYLRRYIQARAPLWTKGHGNIQ